MKNLFAAAALLLSLTVVSFADIARPVNTPTPAPAEPTKVAKQLNVRILNNSDKAVLEIPQSLIDELRKDSGATASASVMSKTQNIVAGLFLSLAVVFGGIWMARGRSRSGFENKAMVALVGVSIMAAAATAITANVAPVRSVRLDSAIFANDTFRYGRMYGDIDVVVTDGDLRLLVPAAAEKGAKAKKNGEEE